jgi:hypothetical protein
MKALILGIVLTMLSTVAQAVDFGGYTWVPRQEGLSAPGPNRWNANQVQVTPKGLQFTLTRNAGAYATTNKYFLYGHFKITIEADYDHVDDLAVFSPYLYHEAADGVDRTREIDIVEFSRWGASTAPLQNFTQWPNETGYKPKAHKSHLPAGTRLVTVELDWRPDRVTFSSSNGDRWTVTDPMYINHNAMHLRFNIRFMRGVPSNPLFTSFNATITSLEYTP